MFHINVCQIVHIFEITLYMLVEMIILYWKNVSKEF